MLTFVRAFRRRGPGIVRHLPGTTCYPSGDTILISRLEASLVVLGIARPGPLPDHGRRRRHTVWLDSLKKVIGRVNPDCPADCATRR